MVIYVHPASAGAYSAAAPVIAVPAAFGVTYTAPVPMAEEAIQRAPQITLDPVVEQVVALCRRSQKESFEAIQHAPEEGTQDPDVEQVVAPVPQVREGFMEVVQCASRGHARPRCGTDRGPSARDH